MAPRGKKRTNLHADDLDAGYNPLAHDPRVKALVRYAPRNRRELHQYYEKVLGLKLATRPVVDGHDAPMDFFEDVYFKLSPSAMAIANRGGGKSYGSAATHTLNMVTKPGIDIANVAAVQRQAMGLYEYIAKGFSKQAHLKDEFDEVLMGRTTTHGGSLLAILPGTLAGVSGPHPNMTLWDEVEFVDWGVLQQGISMAQAKNGYPAQNIYISTRQRIYGSMNRLSEASKRMGIREYRWAVWESMAKCPKPYKDRPDIIDLPTCKGCPLLENCWKDADQHGGVPRGKRANGFMALDDILQRRTQMDDAQWAVQMECERPSKKGLVYTEFDESVHIDHQFALPLPEPGDSVYLMADYGFHPDPTVVLLAYQYKSGYTYVFKEFVLSEMTPDEVAREVADWCDYHDVRVVGGVSDSSEPALVKAFNKRFGPQVIIPSPDKSIENGITSVKLMLRPKLARRSPVLDANGVPIETPTDPRLRFRPVHRNAKGEPVSDDPFGCSYVFEEFNQYHYTDQRQKDPIDIKVTRQGALPVDSFNHALDAVRYYCHTFFGHDRQAVYRPSNLYQYVSAVKRSVN